MKCMYVAAVAAALVSTTLFTGCEKDDSLSAKVEQVSKDEMVNLITTGGWQIISFANEDGVH